MKRAVLSRNEMKAILGGIEFVDDGSAFGCNECSGTTGCKEGYDCIHDYYPGCRDDQRYQCIKKKS